MNILILTWRDASHRYAGGAEFYTSRVAEEWVKSGHEVTVLSARTAAPADELVGGVRYIRVGNTFTVYREARKFYEARGPDTYDLVVDQINTRPFMAPSFVSDAPVVALAFQVAREVWHREVPTPAALVGRYLLEPTWLRRYRDVPTLTISESSRRSLELYGMRRVEVVPVGMDPPPPVSGRKEDRFTAVFVGRLADNKRPEHALEAMRLVRQTLPEAALWIVGRGPAQRRLARMATEDDTILGGVGHEEKYELMSRAHVLLATSTREGWGMVVTEAASVGTPSAGYDVPGLTDSIRAAGGVLVPPSPAALARAVVDIAKGNLVLQPTPSGVLPWSVVAECLLERAVACMP